MPTASSPHLIQCCSRLDIHVGFSKRPKRLLIGAGEGSYFFSSEKMIIVWRKCWEIDETVSKVLSEVVAIYYVLNMSCASGIYLARIT